MQHSIHPAPMAQTHPGLYHEKVLPGIWWITMTCTPDVELTIPIDKVGAPVEFGYVLEGRGEVQVNRSSHPLSEGVALVHSYPEVRGEMRMAPSGVVRMAGINVEHDVLAAYLEGHTSGLKDLREVLERPDSRSLWAYDRMDALEHGLVHQLMHADIHHGAVRRLFVQAKVLELLALRIERLSTRTAGETRSKVALTRSDNERIRAASAILAERMHEPPSLPELAKEVGLNLNKLKQGFKQELGTTPYRHLHEQRMQRAWHELTQNDMNVSETAWAVGYTNVSHFCRAFLQRFGVRPGCLLRDMRDRAAHSRTVPRRNAA